MRQTLIACLWLSLDVMARPSVAADPPVYSAELFESANKGDEQAFAKLLQLAEGGHAQAQYDVSQYYLFKIHKVDEEMPRIASWLQKAADQGVSKAQLDLGVTLNMPGKLWYDPVQALKWFYIGMALTLEQHPDGSQDHYAVFAANNSQRLTGTLSKEQVSEAESLSRAWLDAHGIGAKQEGRNLGEFVNRYKARHP
jgi:TPR repeat protein